MIDENIRRLENGETFSELDNEVIGIIKKAIEVIKPKEVVVRIAGGWVRDKILGKENDDIDIAISGATCTEFSDAIVKVLGPNTKVVTLEANHEQSKHLDTARVCLFRDFWLDICGLRSAFYAEGETSEGTALSDAKHRDFSMNAILFNVQTNKIEDYVNGVQSIKDKVIRTPIPAMQDFTDDPNRIIRCFRFVAKYDLSVDDEIYKAIPKIIPLFLRNITKDRIATELIKMLHAKSAFKALEKLIESGMLNPVFDPEGHFDLNNEATLECIRRVHEINPDLQGDDSMICYFSAIFFPLNMMKDLPDPQRKNKPMSAVHYAIVRTMRLQNNLAENVKRVHLGVSLIESIFKGELNRVTAGRFVMNTGPIYRLCRNLLKSDEILVFYDKVLEPYIVKEDLTKAYEMKQIMDGIALANLHGIKPGPGLKDLIEEMINWQLANPKGTADEYTKHVLAHKNK